MYLIKNVFLLKNRGFFCFKLDSFTLNYPIIFIELLFKQKLKKEITFSFVYFAGFEDLFGKHLSNLIEYLLCVLFVLIKSFSLDIFKCNRIFYIIFYEPLVKL